MSVDLWFVPPLFVAQAWTPEVEAIVESVAHKAPGAPITSVEARQNCMEGNWQLWLAMRGRTLLGLAVTGILHEENVCEWLITGGSHMGEWSQFRTRIEGWARDNGCVAMRSVSRPGMWRRFLQSYRVRGFILERAL